MESGRAESTRRVRNDHETSNVHNSHHADSIREIFLRALRGEGGIHCAPVRRTKERESRVLVLYTGGTIGMLKNDENGTFRLNYFSFFT